VISAADGFSTLYDLLDGKYVTRQLKTLHKEWPLWNPVVLVNLGVARDFSGEPSITIFKPGAEADAGFLTGEAWVIRVFNYCGDCAPSGRTLMQVMVESKWQPWKDLREDREAYDAEKKRTVEQVLERLNELWPGIQGQVEMTNMATPHTWWRFTRNRCGSFEGFAVTGRTFTTQVKRILPGLDRFYMAGQWVVPGGGVIPTLMSGKHAAMLMCRRDGKTFQVL
jgi:hypothetical protein